MSHSYEDFMDRVKGHKIRLTSWGEITYCIPKYLNMDGSFQADLFMDGEFIKEDAYQVWEGLVPVDPSEQSTWKNYWEFVEEESSREKVEIPEWKLWDNVSKDIQARQDELMRALRRSRLKEEDS